MSLVSGLLNQMLTSISSVAKNVYGDQTFTVVYSNTYCRWEETTEMEMLTTGVAITYTVQLWLFPEVDIRKGYRVIKDSKNYTARKIDKKYDLDGNHDHTKVYLN